MGVFIFLCILILFWQLFYWVSVDIFAFCKPYAVPSPLGVGERFVELCSDGTLLSAIGNSLLKGIVGYGIAVVVGLVLGLLINHFRYLQKNLKPVGFGHTNAPQCVLGALFHFMVWAVYKSNFVCCGNGLCLQYCNFGR